MFSEISISITPEKISRTAANSRILGPRNSHADTLAHSGRFIDSNLTRTLRAFDSAFVMQQISNQIVKDGVSDSFMSHEDINEWLNIYKDNVGNDDLTTEELLIEFNLFMPYIALGLNHQDFRI